MIRSEEEGFFPLWEVNVSSYPMQKKIKKNNNKWKKHLTAVLVIKLSKKEQQENLSHHHCEFKRFKGFKVLVNL